VDALDYTRLHVLEWVDRLVIFTERWGFQIPFRHNEPHAGRGVVLRVRGLTVLLLVAMLPALLPRAALAAPVNDDFADAIAIPSGGGVVQGESGGATREPGEPHHAGIANATSVWFRWIPTGADRAGHVELVDGSAASAIAVYTGSAIGTLKLVGNSSNCTPNVTSDDPGAGPCVWFTAVAGTTYRIAIVPSSDPTSSFSLRVEGRSCTVEGTDGNDELQVTAALDIVCGFGGSDVIQADGPVDDLGDPDERQEDVILGGPGADTVEYGGAPSVVFVDLEHEITTLPALNANREVVAEIGNAVGTHGADRLDGTDGPNALSGGAGNDVLNGRAGGDLLLAGGGVDRVSGHEGDDTLYGGRGIDLFFPGPGDDVLFGEGNRDTVSYRGAPNGVVVDLAAGTAVGWGADELHGVENAIGSGFRDVLRGSPAVNLMWGKGGADTIRTDDGVAGDTADGGAGSDTCLTDPGDTRVSCP